MQHPYYNTPGFSYKTQAAAPWYTNPVNYGQHGQAQSYDHTGYSPQKSLGNMKSGYKAGSSAYDVLKGLKDSPLGAMFGGGPGNAMKALHGSAGYKGLLAKSGQNFGDYWNQVSPYIEQQYGPLMAHLKAIVEGKNPSGMGLPSAELLAAPELAGIESGAQEMRRGLMSAGGAGGDRSGLAELASFLPGSMMAHQSGGARARAGIAHHDLSSKRAAINSQMKMGALSNWTGAAGHKSGMAAAALGEHSALQQSALTALMQSILQAMGIDASMMPQLNLGTDQYGNVTWGMSGPLAGFA